MRRFVTVSFFGLVLTFLFLSAMGRNLNHDEHQFIAPAAFLEYDGLQPYRDFPLFHLPNLVFLYAALFRVFDHPFLVARIVSVLCAFATVLLIFRESPRRFVGIAAVILLVLDPLVSFTTGRAWNHDNTGLLVVLAIILQVNAARRDSIPHAIASAMFGGLAAGTRLTCAPILIPLWLSIWFFPTPIRRRTIIAGIYVATATAALAPSLYYLFVHTDAFLFGNFEFPRLRLLDPENERIRKTMNPLRKLRFFFKEVALPSLPLFLAYVAFTVRRRVNFTFPTLLILGILPFALLGCFAPSRYQYQHFFIIIPLLVLGVVYGMPTMAVLPRCASIGLIVSVLTCSFLFCYFSLKTIAFGLVDDWFPNRVARIGAQIREYSPRGSVLTLAPIYPIEGGLKTYPEFATGPFAWKSAPFVPAERRTRLHVIAPDDLEAFLAAKPPGAVLTGVEDKALEKPLVEYSRAHRFVPVNLGKERTLWIPPAP